MSKVWRVGAFFVRINIFVFDLNIEVQLFIQAWAETVWVRSTTRNLTGYSRLIVSGHLRVIQSSFGHFGTVAHRSIDTST